MMEEYTAPSLATYAKRMTVIIGIVTLVIIAGGAVFYRSFEAVYFGAGAVLTAAANVLKLYWLKRSVEVASNMDAARGSLYIRGQGLLRFLLTLAILVGVGFLALQEAIGFGILYGAAIGLMSMPIAGYAMKFFVKKDYGQ